MQQDIKIPSNLYPIRTIEASSSTYPVVHQDGNYYVDIPYTRPGEVAAIVFYDESYNRISDLNWQLISGNTIRIYIGSYSYDKIYLALYNEVNQLPENYLELFCLDNITSGLRNYRMAVGKKKFATFNINVGDMLDELVANIEGGLLSKDGNLGEYQGQAQQARNNLGIYSKSEIDRNLFKVDDTHNIYDLNATIPDKSQRTGNQICVADEFQEKVYPNAIGSYKLLPYTGGYYRANSSLTPQYLYGNKYGMLPAVTSEDYQIYNAITGKDATQSNTTAIWKSGIPYTNTVRMTKLYYNDSSTLDNRTNYLPMLSVNLHLSLPKYDTSKPYQVSYFIFDIVTDNWGSIGVADPLWIALMQYVNSLPDWAKQSLSSWPISGQAVGGTLIRTARLRTEFKSTAYTDDYHYNSDSGNNSIEKYTYDGSQNLPSGTRESRSLFDFSSILDITQGYYGDLSGMVSSVDVGGADAGINVRWSRLFKSSYDGFYPKLARQEKNTVNAYLYYRSLGGVPVFGIMLVINSSIYNYGECDMLPRTNIELPSGDAGNNKWGNNEYWLTGDILLG